MSLIELIRKIEAIAIAQPSINEIVENDIYKLNMNPQAKYGVFAFTQNQHTGNVNDDYITYAFTLFYVDRLTNGQTNQLDIQSTGVQTLVNILKTLNEEGVEIGTYNLQPFNQRFADECAGVYCTVNLSVTFDNTCEEIFNANTK